MQNPISVCGKMCPANSLRTPNEVSDGWTHAQEVSEPTAAACVYLDDEEAPLAVCRHITCTDMEPLSAATMQGTSASPSVLSSSRHCGSAEADQLCASHAPERILSPKSKSIRVMSQPSPVASGQLMRISRTPSSPSGTRLCRGRSRFGRTQEQGAEPEPWKAFKHANWGAGMTQSATNIVPGPKNCCEVQQDPQPEQFLT